ncbi:MAG: copper chaperone PCu(A)C [Balneola sp.]
MKTTLLIILGFLMSLACGESPKKDSNTLLETQEVTNWARPGAQSQMSGAYLVYKNTLNIADTLVSVNSNVAKMTQIHESYTTEDGLAGMREMKQVIIESQEELTLERGGLHIMLMNLKSDLSTGDSIYVQLTFTQAGEVNLSLPVLGSN